MFDLVADVEAYPEFLPLCESLVVHSRRKDGDREILVATMTIAYKFIRESFTSQVDARPAGAFDPRRVSRRAVQLSRERLALRAAWARRLHRPLHHRLRVPLAHARPADGRGVRPRLSQIRRRLRGAGRRGLRDGGLNPSGRDRGASSTPTSHRRRGGRRSRPRSPKRSDGVNRCARRVERAAKWTSPTGFSGVPPPGPAMPVIATARSAGEWASAPSAIARATSSLTAPSRCDQRRRHAEELGLRLVRVGDEARGRRPPTSRRSR